MLVTSRPIGSWPRRHLVPSRTAGPGISRFPLSPPRRLASSVHVAVTVGVALLALVTPVREARSWPAALAVAGCAAVLVGTHLAGFGFGRIRYGVAALVMQAALGFLPVALAGGGWSVLSGYFGGSVLLATKPLWSVPAALTVAVVAGVLAAVVPGGHLIDGLSGGVATLVLAATVFGLAGAVRRAVEHEGERDRVIAEERRRFHRDTHDLLGLSLSAITLKGELTSRLIDEDPDRARGELSDLLAMSRRALADVRAVAAGPGELSLEEECRSAVVVLRAAGIAVPTAVGLPGRLPVAVASTLATVLREAITNVIRHSEAIWCEFSVERSPGSVRLVVRNDGACPPQPGPGGSGLRNLRHRVGELGGELTAGVSPDGCYRLDARIPLP